MPLPRGMAALAIAWIVASFAITVGSRTPIQPTSGAYTPEVRTFLALLALGGCVLWPVGRIMLAPDGFCRRRTALDAATLVVLLQAIYWPTHLVTSWPLMRALAIDALLCGWVIAFGAAIAWATGPGRRRAGWAIACIALAGGGAVLDAMGIRAPLPEIAGPFAALLTLAPLGAAGSGPAHWELAAWPWVVAFTAWCLLMRAAPEGSRVAPLEGFR